MAAEKYFNIHTVIIMQFTSDERMTFLNLALTLEHDVKTVSCFVLICQDHTRFLIGSCLSRDF